MSMSGGDMEDPRIMTLSKSCIWKKGLGNTRMDWQTVDKDNFYIRMNGDVLLKGSYSFLMTETPLYDASNETHETSHKMFHDVFKNGFAWEVLEVYSGPPKVSFTWRHWGKWEEPYKDTPPTEVNDKNQIISVEVFFDPNTMLMKLTKGGISSCPFASSGRMSKKP
ncbi:PRPX-like protein, partial [Mya arenaria]